MNPTGLKCRWCLTFLPWQSFSVKFYKPGTRIVRRTAPVCVTCEREVARQAVAWIASCSGLPC